MNIFTLYLLAYAIMMAISSLHLMFNWKVLGHGGYTSLQDVKTLGIKVEAYQKTTPYQPVYNLVVFSILSAIYLRGLSPSGLFVTGLVWVAISAIADPVLWALLPHPWRVTLREFYGSHMPWLLLCYLCVLISPFIALLF